MPASRAGADWMDDFTPDGATGTFHPFRVTVHVYRPRHGHLHAHDDRRAGPQLHREGARDQLVLSRCGPACRDRQVALTIGIAGYALDRARGRRP